MSEDLEQRQKMFPLQASNRKGTEPGPMQIPWSVAEKAYGVYALKYGKSQTLERLGERGGFSWCEMDQFYPGWRQETGELAEARETIARLEGEAETLKQKCVLYDIAIRGTEERAERAEAENARLWEVIEEAIVVSCTDCAGNYSLADPPYGQHSMGCRHTLPTGHETHCQAWPIHTALHDVGLSRAALKGETE